MNTLTIASDEADARAAAAVEQHHAEMAGRLQGLVEGLLTAVESGNAGAAVAARGSLVAWLRDDLMPHAVAEEKAMYPAAHGTERGRLLVDGMLAEHTTIGALVDEVEQAPTPVRAAAAARALRALFESHLAKENELVLPLLAADPTVSVAALLGGMHELLGGHGHDHDHGPGEQAEQVGEAPQGGCGGHCSCGEVDTAEYPELDARAVPHAIRHATIFGALDVVAPGGGMVLVAPHDPLPLLAQLEERAPQQFEVSYLERGPEAWRIQLVRRTA
jgi:uncharacterized protein (DUF2249 family)/iron-sulfur cluster repair protein YtfE (RIC family)